MRFSALVLLLIALAAPAHAAQSKAFAAVSSPEQSFDTCHEADVMSAIACAMKKCTGAGGTECAVITACSDGWAGFMDVSTGEIGFTDAVCGLPDKALVITALTGLCKGSRKFAKSCTLSAVFSPQGVETSINKELDPKKLK